MIHNVFRIFIFSFVSEFSFAQNLNTCTETLFFNSIPRADTSFNIFLSGEVHHQYGNEKISLELFKQLYNKNNVRLFLFELGYCHGIVWNDYLENNNPLWLKYFNSPKEVDFAKSLKQFYDSLPINDKFQIIGIDYEKGIDIFLLSALKTLLPKQIDTMLNSTQLILAGIKKMEFCDWYCYPKISPFILALQNDIKNEEPKMRSFWGNNYTKILKIIYQYDMRLRVSKSNKKGKELIQREEYIYDNIKQLRKEFPNKNMYGQFGRAHIPITYQIKYEKKNYWESFAGKLNTRDDSPFKNKVCSFYIYYSDKSFERKFYISQKNEILEKIKTVEKNDTPILVDLKCIDTISFNNFTKTTFQYLIINPK